MRNNKKNIRQCIKEKGVKMKYIAKMIGITPQHFGKKLKTPWKFTVAELIKIADILDEKYSNFDIGIN
jgi:transcriptional regulator with XRE-family HTH domain